MRVLISAGGTGGHINPSLAVGKYIMEQNEKNSVLFIGANGEMDKKLYSGSGMDYRLFDSQGLDRKNLLKNFSILLKDYKAYRDILKVVSEFKPDVGISGGGYISAMTMMCLKKKKIPFIVHEQNAIAGLTTKLLSKYAVKYAYAFESANKLLKYPKRGVYTGNPVRKEFFLYDKNSAREKLGFKKDDKIILVFGGSLGARKINDIITALIPEFKEERGIKLVCGTGKFYYKDYSEYLNKYENIIIKEYIDDMPLWLTACDIAVTRAGAMTVSELCAIKKPSVLIPSPNVTADHQTKNADQLVKVGGAIKISEQELTSEKLYNVLIDIIRDEKKLESMEKNLEPLSICDGDKRIFDIVKSICN